MKTQKIILFILTIILNICSINGAWYDGYLDVNYLSADNLDANLSTKDKYNSLFGIGSLNLFPHIGGIYLGTTVRGFYTKEEISSNNIKNTDKLSKALVDQLYLEFNWSNVSFYYGRRYLGEPNDIGFYFGPPTWPYGIEEKDLLSNNVDVAGGLRIRKNKSSINIFTGQANYKEMSQKSTTSDQQDIPTLIGVNMKRNTGIFGNTTLYLDYYSFLQDISYYQKWGVFNDIPSSTKISLWDIGFETSGSDGSLVGKYYWNVLKNVPDEERKRKAYYISANIKMAGSTWGGEYMKKDSDFIPINSDYKPAILLSSLDGINSVLKWSIKFSVYEYKYFLKIDGVWTSGKIGNIERNRRETDLILESSLSYNLSLKAYYALVSEDYLTGKTTAFGANIKYLF